MQPSTNVQAEAFEIAARFRRAAAGEWQDVLGLARHNGWAGPVSSEVTPGGHFALRKAGIEVRIFMSGDVPADVLVLPI